MSTTLYANAAAYVNGALLAEATSVSVDRKSNSSPVSTLAKQYAGESPGAATVEVKIESAVPSGGFELDVSRYLRNTEPVELVIFAAGVTLTMKGFFTDDSFSHSVNQEAKHSLSFRGEFSSWT